MLFGRSFIHDYVYAGWCKEFVSLSYMTYVTDQLDSLFAKPEGVEQPSRWFDTVSSIYGIHVKEELEVGDEEEKELRNNLKNMYNIEVVGYESNGSSS